LVVNIFKMSFAKRLTQIISELGYNKNSFAELLKYENNNQIYDYTREDDKWKRPGFEFFERLVQSKVGISIEWLMTGEGDRMNKKGTAATNNEAAVQKVVDGLLVQLSTLNQANLINAQTIATLLGSKMVEHGQEQTALAKDSVPAQ
jgi:hypothetical protein